MDVARAPAGYRDVRSWGGRLVRAPVAGEFVRVARLHQARMSGQAFWLLWGDCQSDSPEGAKQKISADSVRRATPSK